MRLSLLGAGLLSACTSTATDRMLAEPAPHATNTAPEATITSHSASARVLEDYIESFRGTVADSDHETEALLVTWYWDTEVVCPAATPAADGSTGCDLLISADTEAVSLEVHDPTGATGSHVVPLQVQLTLPPVAVIAEPIADGTDYSDQDIPFSGLLSDSEDEPSLLTAHWESDQDGVLAVPAVPDSEGLVRGQGVLTEGPHTLWLHVEDVTGKTSAAQTAITVAPQHRAELCPHHASRPACGRPGRARPV